MTLHGSEPVEQAVVARFLEIERRRQQEARAAQHQPGAALRDRLLDRSGGDADHQLSARIDPRADQGAERAVALVEAERSALAGRAEHGQAVAAVGQGLQAVGDEARQVDRPVLGERRRKGDGKTESVDTQRH